jgi:O-acetyl-ADP-ribose deacetylase (regulator of RNase III)
MFLKHAVSTGTIDLGSWKMIRFKIGNILAEEADALVNTVNCVGVMGKGIALQFKKAYPQNFEAYAAACKQEKVQPGLMLVYEVSRTTKPNYIINFPTKRHWRARSQMKDIQLGLKSLSLEIQNRKIKSVAMPALGCGLGGLNWPDVKSEIVSALSGLTDTDIVVFEPAGRLTVGEMSPTGNSPEHDP